MTEVKQDQDEAGATLSFESVFNQSPDALILADREGAIRLWNPRAERIFGYAAADILGASLDVIIPERFRTAHWLAFRRALETGATKYGGRTLVTRALHHHGRK